MIKGFTLPELLVSIGILAIVGTISAPSVGYLIEKNKVESDVFTVKNIIETTRAKAITTNSYYILCGADAADKCSRNWRHLKVVERRSKELQYKTEFHGEYESVTWAAFQSKPSLTIAPSGYTDHQNGTLYLCHKHDARHHRALIVSKSGRVTTTKNSEKLNGKCSVKA